MSDLIATLLAIKQLAGDERFMQCPAFVKTAFVGILEQVNLAIDFARASERQSGPPAKRLFVIESPAGGESLDALAISAKLAACNLPHELLILPPGAALSVIGDEFETEPDRTEEGPATDPAAPHRLGGVSPELDERAQPE